MSDLDNAVTIQEPSDAQQDWIITIDLHDGSGVQKFIGKTHQEALEKVAKAQANSTWKVREQAREIKLQRGFLQPEPDDPMPSFKPRSLTADEQWRLSQELQDPAKCVGAVSTIMESRIGASMEKITEAVAAVETAKRQQAMVNVATDWGNKHRGQYYASDENNQRMMEYVTSHKMAVTENNLNIAFQDLRDSGLLEARPEAAEVPAQPTEGIPPRPRSSSLRPSNSSASRVPAQASTITWATIDKWSSDEMEKKMRDPEIVKQVNALDPRLRYAR
jgi:hypothetical protein